MNNSYDPSLLPPPFLFLCPLLLLPLPLSTHPLLLSCWGWSPDPYTCYTNALLLRKLWKHTLEGQGVYRDPEAAAGLIGCCWAENGYGRVKEEELRSQGGGTDHVDLEDARSRWQSSPGRVPSAPCVTLQVLPMGLQCGFERQNRTGAFWTLVDKRPLVR